MSCNFYCAHVLKPSPRFKTPRSVMALRFVTALGALVNAAGKPGQLKTQVETVGFQHLDIEARLG